MMHTNRTRTFIAVPIQPPRGINKLLQKLDQLGAAVKPIPSDQMHITLKFLGQTDLNDIVALCSVLKKMRTEFSKTKLSFNGLGAFPRADRPNVIWAGITKNASVLKDMAEYLETEAEKIGYARERKGFHAHLTLARIKSKPPEELFQILEDRRDALWGETTMDSIKFYQSELKSQRAQYHEMQTVNLI